ncbi:MAG TPA: T9SS type A sorting domain-containing protein [Bacteroidales bacterium]|nr:T9SS type A sorting domain-containing protein [Bacteroidales bacterium]HQI69230.1 T9SS type A sorting domain-containing protein [Bacteroidales bacterium]
MKKFYYTMLLSIFILTGFQASSQIIISAMMPNPVGSDSAYEYVQLMATQNINFASTPYSVVVLNNGSATVKGWANGLNISYKYNLTSGTVSTGDVFYVGGDKMRIDGPGSTDLSGLTWIRTINNVTTTGDDFGNLNATGVFGNGGSNADGVGVFFGTTIDSTSIPVDALFFGTGIGTAYVAGPPEKGYKVPTNDHYSESVGLFGSGTNSFYAPCTTLQDTLLSFTGTYDTTLSTWTINRTPAKIKLTAASLITDINTNITLTGMAVGITTVNKDMVNIYPNPSNGQFSINNLSGKTMSVRVYDILGNSVYQTRSSQKEIHINMATADRGMYFVELTDPSGARTVKKITLQ